MKQALQTPAQALRRLFAALLLGALLFLPLLPARAMENSRLEAGMDFFPSFLAADADITRKAAPDGHLDLVILHRGDLGTAERLARRLEQVGRVRGLPIRVTLSDDIQLSRFRAHPPAGLFLAQPRIDDLHQVLDWGRKHGRIVFSPFRGDVARGVPGGVSVREVVLPLVNQRTMERWGIRLKPFFLRIARRHDG